MKTNLGLQKLLLCDPVSFGSAVDRLENMRAGLGLDDDDEDELDMFGDVIPKPYDLAGGVRVIPVRGVLGYNLPRLASAFGILDMAVLQGWLEQACDDDAVQRVLLDVSSPGGVVTGTPETAALVATMGKPTCAYTADLMASGAYWLSSQCDAVFASRSAEVGSIGVYMAVADVSRMAEAAGVHIEVIKAGKYKAAGYPGTPLTDDQRAQFQTEVDEIYQDFQAAVVSKRKGVNASAMQGQTFSGTRAGEEHLVSGLKNFKGAVAWLTRQSTQ